MVMCSPSLWNDSAHAAPNLKMMIPGGVGGGWDATGRALGRAILQAKLADGIRYENKGGSAGLLGLNNFINSSRGDSTALMVMGSVMVSGILSSKSTVTLGSVTPIARLASEYNVFVVPENSPLKNMQDLVKLFQKDPASVTWGGGSKATTEHIAACLLATIVQVDPKKVNYVSLGPGAEVTAAVLSGKVTVAGGGYSEFSENIKLGRLRALGVTSPKRLPGINIPTLKEQGYRVVLDNWRGVYGAPDTSAEQQDELIKIVTAATRTKSWTETIEKNSWSPSLVTGKDFAGFVEYEFPSIQLIMYLSGMIG
jgi:putative tricarboxylic transport membrane protein